MSKKIQNVALDGEADWWRTDVAGWEKRRSDAHKFYCEGESMTEQSHAEACDINNIIAKHSKTGLVSHLNTQEGQFGDFTGATDYHSALNAIRLADESFMELPAEIRKVFDNDPGKLIDFMSDDRNFEKAVELGLVERPPRKDAKPPAPPAEPEKKQ